MTVDTILPLPADVAQLTQRVAELERHVEILQDELGMYLQILDAVPDMVLCKGPQSRIIYGNRAFREFYGMNQEQLQGMIDAPFVEPDYTQQYIRDDQHVFTTGETLDIPEEPITRYDGVIHYVHTVKSPLKNSTDQIVGTMGVFRDITGRKQAEADIQIYDRIVKHIPLGLMVLQLDQTGDPASFRLTTANPTAGELAGFDIESEIGQLAIKIFPNGLESGLLQAYARAIQSGQPQYVGEVAYRDERVTDGIFSVRAFPLSDSQVCVAFDDITERKRAEAALHQSIAQEEMIRAQEAALKELSTPLLTISDQVVVMPLVGSIDSARAQGVLDSLLHGIAAAKTQVAILDITGVPIVDTGEANGLVRAAQAVQLLGAQVVLTGIRPEVAQTLVGLGVDLRSIVTRATLQSGIAFALGQQNGVGASQNGTHPAY